MKNSIIVLLLSITAQGFSQDYKFDYEGRMSPTVKKEMLAETWYTSDITPKLWHSLMMPHKDRDELEARRRVYYPLGFFLYPLGGYDTVVDYVSVEISARRNGELFSASSRGDKLSSEQRDILISADMGSDIKIKIRFKYKKHKSDKKAIDDKIMEGDLSVTVVPATEAEYPGGYKQLSNYFSENIIKNLSEKGIKDIRQAIVKFTVNEEGEVVNINLFTPSGDPKIEQLILNAINKMPKWKPAKNSQGVKVKQEFIIPFGGDGC
jgi:TonB family protein